MGTVRSTEPSVGMHMECSILVDFSCRLYLHEHGWLVSERDHQRRVWNGAVTSKIPGAVAVLVLRVVLLGFRRVLFH